MHRAKKWAEVDLLTLVRDGVGESVSLEFKSCGALERTERNKKELARDVTALANSAGGVIVYGVQELGNGRFELDQGLDPSERSCEWVEDVLSAVQQRIEGVDVHSVSLETHSPGREAIVVYVPQSTRAPHQAPDYKFYKRHGSRVLPMEEYEVRDVSRRQLACDLRVDIVFGPALGIPRSRATEPRWVDLNLRLTNNSDQLCEYASVDFWVDHRLEPVDIPYAARVAEPIGRAPNAIFALRISIPFNGRNGIPVFRGVPVYATNKPIRLLVPRDGIYAFKWMVHAPLMQPRSAYGILTWKENSCDRSRRELSEEEFSSEEGLQWELTPSEPR
ncbi:MAG TPA: ATP-binding protein [Gemmatimonadaceae bacterium]|nr:ATP-binding protein [Gemmatimonadaceae bacterium]